jgi:hypothetical protein
MSEEAAVSLAAFIAQHGIRLTATTIRMGRTAWVVPVDKHRAAGLAAIASPETFLAETDAQLLLERTSTAAMRQYQTGGCLAALVRALTMECATLVALWLARGLPPDIPV